MWHASIAYLKSSGPVMVEQWGGGTLRAARLMLDLVLEGVGSGETVERVIRAVVHRRRSLSSGEMATLSAEWLAIPAVDHFSIEDET